MSPVVALSLFWFLYMGAMGMFFPFYALYLGEAAALRGAEVGAIMSMMPLVGLAAPTLWGRVADQSGRGPLVLATVTVGAAGGLVLLGIAQGFWALLAATALAAFFMSAVMPLAVSVSLSALGEGAAERFGRVRMWGTVGYLALVLGFPIALHHAPARFGTPPPGLGSMFVVGSLLTLGAAASVASLAPVRALSAAERRDWTSLFAHRPFVRMLAFSFLAQLMLQGPMNLFPIYVRSQGGGLAELSLMWTIMLLPEIPLVALSGAGLRRFGARALLGVGLFAGALRWLVCGWVDDLVWIYAAQALHGVLVAGLMVGAPLYLDASVPPRLRATAQGLLSMAGIGVGGIVSSLATGWLVDVAGADAPYQIGGAGALLLALLVPRILPRPVRPA